MSVHPPKPADLLTPSGAQAADALGAAGVTQVTGTGKAVLDTAPTMTGATVNELTTATITRISLLEYICANDFDPTDAAKVAALTGAAATAFAATVVGARCSTIDGTKCWQKYSATATDWKKLHRTIVSQVVSGGPYATFDLTVAVSADEWCEFLYAAGAAVGNDWLYLRIDGSTKAGVGANSISGPSSNVFMGTTSSSTCKSKILISPSINGFRQFHEVISDSRTNGWNGTGVHSVQVGAIASIGIYVAGGGSYIPNDSVLSAETISKKDAVFP